MAAVDHEQVQVTVVVAVTPCSTARVCRRARLIRVDGIGAEQRHARRIDDRKVARAVLIMVQGICLRLIIANEQVYVAVTVCAKEQRVEGACKKGVTEARGAMCARQQHKVRACE